MLGGVAGVSHARRSALQAASLVVPNPIQIRGLVDTGAGGTSVDPSVLTSLGLTPTGSVTVNTPSTGSQPHTADQYDVSLAIPSSSPSHAPLFVPNMPVLCAELFAAQGFHALIGRDIPRRVNHGDGRTLITNPADDPRLPLVPVL